MAKGKKKGKGKGKKKGKGNNSSDQITAEPEIQRSLSHISGTLSTVSVAQSYIPEKSEKKKLKELSLQEQALENSEFWEAKYQVLEETKNEFRNNAHTLSVENELLENQMRQTEVDTIDVVTYLKREDTKKDHKIEGLKANLKSCRRKFRIEKQSLINDFNDQISKLEVQISGKQDEIHLMQNELAHVKEFRKKRALMQRELDEIRDTMFLSNREHREEICRMEQKFLEETISLQKEADQKISELGDRAHHEAMINLDETTKVVYKENMTLSQQLAENIKRGEALKKMQERLREENILLKAEKDNSEATIDSKKQESSKQKTKLKETTNRVEMLETLLNHMIREFNRQRSDLIASTDEFHHETRTELVRLQRAVISKSEECSRVRKLARKILSERSDIERFFLESLQTVREEINNNQLEYKKAASRAYNKRMMAAFAGQGQFPRVRTFNKTDTSTNSVFQDLQAAEMLAETSGAVDISDLTWEQKEKVLRYLFARMNGAEKLQKPAAQPMNDREDLPLKPANQLSLDSRGNTERGTIGADPYYDQPVMERQDSFSRHSVLPDIGHSQVQAITAT